MRFEDAVEFRAALECRLAELAIGNEDWLARDRLRVAFGRWLARLSETAPRAWVLTGTCAIDCLSLRPRTARRLEIEWRAEHAEEFVDAVERATVHDASDLFEFEVEVGGKSSGGKGAWSRYWVYALLAGEPFEVFEFTQHLRFGNIGSQALGIEDLLDFADVPPAEVDVLLSEVLLAERFQSYSSRASGKHAPSSAQALVDLMLIAEFPGLDAVSLVIAAFWIFRMHGEEIPKRLPGPREEWVECYRDLAHPTGASPDLDDGYAAVATLLYPILSGEVERGTWDPGERRWMVP